MLQTSRNKLSLPRYLHTANDSCNFALKRLNRSDMNKTILAIIAATIWGVPTTYCATYGSSAENQPAPTERNFCDSIANDYRQGCEIDTTQSAYERIKSTLAEWGGYSEEKMEKSVVIIDGERLDIAGVELIATVKSIPAHEIARYVLNPSAPKEFKSKGYLIILETKKRCKHTDYPTYR